MPGETIQKFNIRQHMLNHTFEVYHYRDTYLNDVALHHHDFYEVYYFLNGNVNYIIEGRNYHLVPGDLLLISPLELHQPLILPEKRPYERIVLWMSKQFIEQFCTDDTSLTRCFDISVPGHTNLLRLTPQQRQRISDLLDRLLAENSGAAYGAELMMLGTLVELLVEVNRISAANVDRPELADRSDPVVADVLNYINEHYHEPLSLDSLAAHFFVSKYHLLHEFNRFVGTSVYRYIIQKRLIIARQMLADGVPPTDVYQQCGFGDYANFYRAFKAEYHMSPKEYLNGARASAAPAWPETPKRRRPAPAEPRRNKTE